VSLGRPWKLQQKSELYVCIGVLSLKSSDSQRPFASIHPLSFLYPSLCHCILDSFHPYNYWFSCVPPSWWQPLDILFGPSVVFGRVLNALFVFLYYPKYKFVNPLFSNYMNMDLSFLEIPAERLQKSISTDNIVHLFSF
jgi:hypothetical protein